MECHEAGSAPQWRAAASGLPAPYVRVWGGVEEAEVEEIARALVGGWTEAAGEPWIAGQPPPTDRIAELPMEAASGMVGGLVARDSDGVVITPGCCGTLDVWPEWMPFCSPHWEESPWMGHDPTPMLERMETMIRVWSDSDDGVPLLGASAIDFTPERFAEELSLVWEDLVSFEAPLTRWARHRCPGLEAHMVGLWRIARGAFDGPV